MHSKPAVAQRAEHAHGPDGFGVVQMAGGQLGGLLRVSIRINACPCAAKKRATDKPVSPVPIIAFTLLVAII